jgi:two-component system, OmpR family, phosphate regulon sensor histidine kinase PhoR
MSLDDRNQEPADPGTRFTPPRVGPSTWLVLLCLVLALAALRWTDLDPVHVVAAAVAVIVTGWATRVVVADVAPATRLGRRDARRTPWPDSGMKTVVEALDDPCIVVDAGEVVRYVNREATVRYGAVRLGDPLSFRLRVTVLHDALDRVVALNRPEQVEWQEKVPTERWLRGHLSPMRFPPDPRGDDRKPDFVLIRLEDLTESRRVERMRADFVANASHELRTPLAAVTGFIETLQGPARNDAVAREKFLAVMAEQAGRMRRLIDDLLSLSRIEMRAHLKPETVIDLAQVVVQVVDLVAAAAEAAGVELRLFGCDVPRPVFGDRDELIQIFTNLIENGVKYGGAGGRVDISLETEGRHVTAAVRDYGQGIDPVHLPRLTERFYRAHAENSREKRGTGLGLAIVKHIVVRHGGRLNVDSKPGEGSTFSVRLDAPSAGEAAEGSKIE